MDAGRKTRLFFGLLRARVMGARLPLIVSWVLTDRCNMRCSYCNSWRLAPKELSTEKIFSIMDELYDMGTARIQFTGGEPLLREDLGEILQRCRAKGISTNVNTNGLLVPERTEDLSYADTVSISLDGPEGVHDSVRGKGSYRRVMEAAAACRRKGIRFRFLCVLSGVNLGHTDFLVTAAEEYDTEVIFQPATETLLKGSGLNPVSPGKQGYREALSGLLKKRRSNAHIGNSLSGLKHLMSWPDRAPIKCLGRSIFCRLESDGEVRFCPRQDKSAVSDPAQGYGFRDAFNKLRPADCGYCWCASVVELSLVYALDPSAVLNVARFL